MGNQLPLWSSHNCWHDYNAKFSLNILEEEEYGGFDYKMSFGVHKNYQMDELHFPFTHHILSNQYRKDICYLQS